MSIFVPKPFTPFAYAPQNPLVEIAEKIRFLKEKCASMRNVKLNFHNSKLSQVEAFLTRGDKRLNNFIYDLYKSGSYLDSWDENFDYEKYVEIARKNNLDVEFEATKEFSPAEELPWEFINLNYDKNYFKNEYQKAKDIASAT